MPPEKSLITLNTQTDAPIGNLATYTYDDFLARLKWDDITIKNIDTIRLRNIHVLPQEYYLATEFFKRLNLPIPELPVKNPNSWRLRFTQYETSGKTIRKKSPEIWFFDETHASQRYFRSIAYEQLVIIDLLTSLHLCYPMDFFLQNATYYDDIAEYNKLAAEPKSTRIAFAPFLGGLITPADIFPSTLNLNQDLFKTLPDCIDRIDLLSQQFNMSDASVEIMIIQRQREFS